MFLVWKNQHCENDYTTENNLQIHWNPYQATNGTFHRIRTKNFIICMETQKTPNSQNNLEREVSQKGFVILIVTDCSSEWQNKKWNRENID